MGPGDQKVFMVAQTTMIAVGIIFTGIFHCVIHETDDFDDNALSSESNSRSVSGADLYQDISDDDSVLSYDTSSEDLLSMNQNDSVAKKLRGKMRKWSQSFEHGRFWSTVALYTIGRTIHSSLQVFLVLYVASTELKLAAFYIALLPFAQYCSGFLTAWWSLFIKQQKLVYIGGLVFMCNASALVAVYSYLKGRFQPVPLAFAFFTVYGFGSNSLVCSSIALVANYVQAEPKSSSSLVFGISCFCDKVLSGMFIVVVQSQLEPEGPWMYSRFLCYGMPALVAATLPFLYFAQK